MIKQLSDIYLFSDVDGTLGKAGQGIPQRNVDAINRFVAKGGHFAIATGRPVNGARHFVKELHINSPCILSNGCVVYHYEREEFLYTAKLPSMAKDYLKQVIAMFPEMGISAVSPEGYYYIQNVQKIIDCFGPRGTEVTIITPEEIQEDFCKIVMVVDDADCAQTMSTLQSQNFAEVDFISSDTFLIEMMPKYVSKGSAIERICRDMQIPIENTVAVGDYYNDVAMLKMAGLAITVEEAPEDIKAITNLTVGKCMDGAVADVIEHLEQLYK